MRHAHVCGLFVLVALVMLIPVRSSAQTVTNIAYAKEDTDNDFYPDHTTDFFKVYGRITSPNFSTNTTEIFIQDTNDNVGIMVYGATFVADTNAFIVGKEASAQGTIGQINGVRHIKPTLSGWFQILTSSNSYALKRSNLTETLSEPKPYQHRFAWEPSSFASFVPRTPSVPSVMHLPSTR